MSAILIAGCWCVLAFANDTRASHIVGGEMHYEYMGGDSYKVVMKVYRDCYNGMAEFDNPLVVAVYDSAGNLIQEVFMYLPFPASDTLLNNANNPCLVVPPDICVEEAVYEQIVVLPPIPGGYHMVWQRCCRNNTIDNLAGPDTTGATYTAYIPDPGYGTNSDPVFNQFPPTVICNSYPIEFDHSATDLDGDSLVYELCTPFTGGTQGTPVPTPAAAPPFELVTYETPYTYLYPLDANPVLSIDPATGFLSGTPTTVGQYVLGICVKEYRDGVLLSDHKRDFQFNVANCTQSVAAITEPTYTQCQNNVVEFSNTSIGGIFYHWDFGVDSMTSDTSNAFTPTFVYPDTGVYNITFYINPGTICNDSTQVTVHLVSFIEAVATGDTVICPGQSVQLQGTGGDVYSWAPDNGLSSTTTSTVTASPSASTTYLFTTYIDACIDTETVVVSVLPYPTLNATGTDTICKGDTVQLNAQGGNIYAWTPSEGLSNTAIPNPLAFPSVSTTYYLASQDTMSCPVTLFDTVMIEVVTSDYDITADTTIIQGTAIILEATNGTGYAWSPSEGLSGTNVSTPQAAPTVNTTYHVLIEFPNGCKAEDSVIVLVDPNPIVIFPNAFTPNGDGVNDLFRPSYQGLLSIDQFRVFNRWGQLVFETSDISQGWDGAYKGTQADVGTYAFYFVGHGSVTNKPFEFTGNVTLLR